MDFYVYTMKVEGGKRKIAERSKKGTVIVARYNLDYVLTGHVAQPHMRRLAEQKELIQFSHEGFFGVRIMLQISNTTFQYIIN